MVWLLIFMVVLVVASYGVHCLGHAHYTKRIKKGKVTPKVFDMGTKVVPNLSDCPSLEWLAHLMVLIPPLAFGQGVFTEFLGYLPTLLIVRYMFNIVTILPKDKSCNADDYNWKNLALGHCYDKIFSGHFAMANLLTFILVNRGIIGVPLAISTNVLYALLILSLRFHYTVDLLVATAVTYLIYSNQLNMYQLANLVG